VTGKVAPPEIVKPVPLNFAELIVTAVVPVDVNVTGNVDAVLTATLPNTRLDGLIVNVACAALRSSMTKLCEAPSKVAVNVTDSADLTADAFAVNFALVAFAGTVTVAGTVTAALLLAKLKFVLFLVAALSVTVQVSLPAPVIDELPQDNDFNVILFGRPPSLAWAAPADEACTDRIPHTDKKNIDDFSVRRLRRYAFRVQGPIMQVPIPIVAW
jgi:hypothetical protein